MAIQLNPVLANLRNKLPGLKPVEILDFFSDPNNIANLPQAKESAHTRGIFYMASPEISNPQAVNAVGAGKYQLTKGEYYAEQFAQLRTELKSQNLPKPVMDALDTAESYLSTAPQSSFQGVFASARNDVLKYDRLRLLAENEHAAPAPKAAIAQQTMPASSAVVATSSVATVKTAEAASTVQNVPATSNNMVYASMRKATIEPNTRSLAHQVDADIEKLKISKNDRSALNTLCDRLNLDKTKLKQAGKQINLDYNDLARMERVVDRAFQDGGLNKRDFKNIQAAMDKAVTHATELEKKAQVRALP